MKAIIASKTRRLAWTIEGLCWVLGTLLLMWFFHGCADPRIASEKAIEAYFTVHSTPPSPTPAMVIGGAKTLQEGPKLPVAHTK